MFYRPSQSLKKHGQHLDLPVKKIKNKIPRPQSRASPVKQNMKATAAIGEPYKHHASLLDNNGLPELKKKRVSRS